MTRFLDDVGSLEALAWSVGPPRNFRVVVGGARAYWSPGSDQIALPDDVLARLTGAARGGMVCHECGHGWVSRYHLFVDDDARSRVPLLAPALNAIEEGRCETFMLRRYPATGGWFVALYRETGEEPPVSDDLRVRFLWWCARARIDDWRVPSARLEPNPTVRDALEQSRSARIQHARTLPAQDGTPRPAPGAVSAYRAVLGTRFPESCGEESADPWEATVRLAAWRAHQIAMDRILPVLASLGPPPDSDSDRQGHEPERRSPFDRDALPRSAGPASPQSLRRLLQAVVDGDLTAAQLEEVVIHYEGGGSDESRRRAASSLVALHRAMLGRVEHGGGESTLEPPPMDAVELALGVARRIRRRGRTGRRRSTDLEALRRKVEPHVGVCVSLLRRTLERRRRDSEARPFAEGPELDVEAVMRTAVDPNAWTEAFRRPTARTHLDAAVLLLLDLSGSMEGASCRAAQEGVLLLVEALGALSVPFAVHGFQDIVIPLADFGRSDGVGVDGLLVRMEQEILGTAPGGHNQPRWNDDGPCLLEAASALAARPERDQLLIVISDGRPAGRRSNDEDLRQAVAKLGRPASGLSLVGIGLGPTTTHVATFYGDSGIPGVQLEDLPTRLADVVAAFLGSSARWP